MERERQVSGQFNASCSSVVTLTPHCEDHWSVERLMQKASGDALFRKSEVSFMSHAKDRWYCLTQVSGQVGV